MSRVNDLIRQVARRDPELAEELRTEVDLLAERRSFGLNFERHVPENVELPGRPVRRGDKVRVLPPRGEKRKKEHDRLWRVDSIASDDGTASVTRIDGEEFEQETVALEDLVVVAEFRDPIYPGLVSTGKVERGGNKPFHTVINAENYHALQALLYTHRGKVDAIYIDPPYNTRDKDWKYNNDYVDSDDLYKHSKWLAMMERRLLLAKELLNPDESVLIVTIDENEVHRLAMLLEQVFQGAKIQMITSVIKPGGTSRTKEFSRVDEYLLFVFLGAAEVTGTSNNMLHSKDETKDKVGKPLTDSDLWEGMVRRGVGVVRAQRPKQFYPIFVDEDRGAIVSIGEPLEPEEDKDDITASAGLTTVWPIKDDLTEGFWQLSPNGLRAAMRNGTVRVGSYNRKTGQWRIQYMKKKKAQAVMDGTIKNLGKDENGVVIVDYEGTVLEEALSTPRTVWNQRAHDASTGGAGLLNRLLSGRQFPFAKSLYGVEDSLRFFIAHRPAAVVLDFFSGSGTTAHAVMRLNKQDGGRRQSISVTNNEVSAGEERELIRDTYRPGDGEWEALGICNFITKPRIESAVTGKTPEGRSVEGDYKFTDEFPMADGFEENVEFFDLTYEAPLMVKSHRDFERIAPLLWLRAGSVGRRIEDLSVGWDVAESYGVLSDLDQAEPFLEAIEAGPGVVIAFVVTDDDRLFESIARDLPERVEPVRLYESYLKNFEISTARSAR